MHTDPNSSPDNALSVATYNIHKAHSWWGGCHLSKTLQGIDELNADILCLQEVQDQNQQRRQHSQIRQLQGERYPYAAYGANAIYAHGHHGNAILSKYPIIRWQNHDISDHRLEQRGVLHAVIDHPQGNIHLICAHFGLFKGGRLRQAQTLIQLVQHHIPWHLPLIIAGDFNDWNLHVHRVFTQTLHVTDVINHSYTQTIPSPSSFSNHKKNMGRTFPSFAPLLALDRLYVRHCHIHSAHIKSGDSWKHRSDHAPMQALLTPYQENTLAQTRSLT